MNGRVRRLIAIWISFVPVNRARVSLYRWILGYEVVSEARIGWRTEIAVDRAVIGRVVIGRWNRLVGPYALEIGNGSQIGGRNDIVCGEWTAEPEFLSVGYERHCKFGREVTMTDQHVIDVAGGFEVGDSSWLAGRGSQFWTHGAGATDRSIKIGATCSVAAAVRFAPGSGIADSSIVSLGSVVTRRFSEVRCMIAGVPASIVERDFDWRAAKDRGAHDGTATEVSAR